MKTEEVLAALDRERAYQRKIGMKAKSVGEELFLIGYYVDSARVGWVKSNGAVGRRGVRQYHTCMNDLRRIAANAVRIMEQHGVGDEK